MAKPLRRKDVITIKAAHEALLEDLRSAAGLATECKARAKEAAEMITARRIMDVLKEVPVEEINRDRKGFRTKTLRDYGYNTLADLAAASEFALEAIDGISPAAAKEIKALTDEMAARTREGVHIRISADERTPEVTALIRAVSQARDAGKVSEAAIKLHGHYAAGIERALEALAPTSNVFKWLFTSKSKKDMAGSAFSFLTEAINGDYGKAGEQIISVADTISGRTEDEAWADFQEEPIPFFTMIEEIAPGFLGTGDGTYGLPEELARQIQDEKLFPEGLKCTLRRYQEWGVKYILHQGNVLLGDEMGLGKTVQAIAAMVSLKNTGATHFLIVCPAGLRVNWVREIRKHSYLPVVEIYGARRDEHLAYWLRAGGAAVTTYETCAHIHFPEDFRCSMLIADEAHYIKNPEAQRTINTKRLCESAERLLFMTGTALENRVDEMISLIEILNPKVAFNLRGLEFLSAAPMFRERAAAVYYRRKREDVLTELPELIESREWCSLTLEETALYEQAILAHKVNDARRVSFNVPDVKRSSKAKRLFELVEEARDEGRKVVVFSFFLDTIQKVQELLDYRCLPAITGAMSSEERQQVIDTFEESAAGTVLPAQISAGGTGLNIQTASVVVICEPQLKPSSENQAISRVYRMGQTRNVLVYRLLAEDTIDEKILNLLAGKQELFDAFADKSAAAEAEVDAGNVGRIVEEEIERIKRARGDGS